MRKHQHRPKILIILLLILGGCASEGTESPSLQRGASGGNCPKNPPPVILPEVYDVRDAASCLITASLREEQLLGTIELLARGCKPDLTSLKADTAKYKGWLEDCTNYQVGKLERATQ